MTIEAQAANSLEFCFRALAHSPMQSFALYYAVTSRSDSARVHSNRAIWQDWCVNRIDSNVKVVTYY
jgi:hypothetical protein